MTTIPIKTTTIYPNFLQARKITAIGSADPKTSAQKLNLADGTSVVAPSGTLVSYTPVVGDYYIVPDEGDPFCLAKSTFQISYKTPF
jgi:hypothetical protein